MSKERWFFTSDEHFGHQNKMTGIGIIQYCNRPFESVEEMDEELIKRHNEIVTPQDTTVHLGDFSYYNKQETGKIIKRLNGDHIFLEGDHDRWLSSARQVWKKKIEDCFIVCCHWPMWSWPRSHYGSWMLYGHHHGRVEGFRTVGKSFDVGVDTNNFYPYSLDEVKGLMETRPENPGLVKKSFN